MSPHGIPHGGNESPAIKFFVSGSVSLTFELMIGHYLEFLKISKQTSTLTYSQLTRNMVQHKGIVGILDGFFPWGAIQCFVKGASFGMGQSIGMNLCKGKMSDFSAEVVSGGFGGGMQGLVMSPLLLLKTRVMTTPEMRTIKGGPMATAIASSKIGAQVIRSEGLMALMKGSATFSGKRVADWTTRYFFAELCAEKVKEYRAAKEGKEAKDIKLTFMESSLSNIIGGALSATVTLPVDVIVASMQSAAKAGQKTSIIGLWKEQIQSGGVGSLIKYSSRGFVARIVHVGATTLLMKEVSTAVYSLFNHLK